MQIVEYTRSNSTNLISILLCQFWIFCKNCGKKKEKESTKLPQIENYNIKTFLNSYLQPAEVPPYMLESQICSFY